jgi:phosphoribosylformylglycinamidine synthase
VLLFSESNTRFLCEVGQEHAEAFRAAMGGIPCIYVGDVVDTDRLALRRANGAIVVEAELAALKEAWQRPLRW